MDLSQPPPRESHGSRGLFRFDSPSHDKNRRSFIY